MPNVKKHPSQHHRKHHKPLMHSHLRVFNIYIALVINILSAPPPYHVRIMSVSPPRNNGGSTEGVRTTYGAPVFIPRHLLAEPPSSNRCRPLVTIVHWPGSHYVA